jgi:hypothetical protein
VKHWAPKLFLAGAFALTLALKLLLYRGESRPADPEVLGAAISSFLLQHGFEPRIEIKLAFATVYANAGKCRMLISEAEPHGWNRGSIEMRAKPVGRLSFVFDGAVHDHQPILSPVIREYWRLIQLRMGSSASRHPVLAVAASDNCEIDALPWWELSVLS